MISEVSSRLNSWIMRNRAFVGALLLAVSLSLLGANWGRVECWNLDNMAFREIQPNGLPGSGYLKPPLHSYLNHVLVMKPAEALRSILGAEHNFQYPLQLWGTRLLTLALFCGALFLFYTIAKQCCGVRSASILALLMATSAGLIKFNHFGTADSPLLFWMTASLFMALHAARDGKIPDSVFAGLLAGLATADKYNGLGVAIAIPASLLMYQGWKSLFGRQCWAATGAIPVGFVIGNPGALFDTRNFIQDFLYNLYTTPVYNGKFAGSGYLDFLLCIPDLIGWPALLLLVTGIFGSFLLLFQRRLSRSEITLLAAAGSVFLCYYLMIGRFPRMADRFVLPVIPFLFLLSAPGLERIDWKCFFPRSLLIICLAYNIICSLIIGSRFLSDPRMDAELFALKHFPAGSVIENSYAPGWNRLPGLKVTVHEMPNATGRSELFSSMFGQNAVIAKGVEKFESPNYPSDTFTEAGLKKRHPDFVAFSDQVFDFTGDDQAQRFYKALADGQLGYVKIFDQSSPNSMSWAYPRNIDFLADRMLIFKKSAH